MRNRIVVLGICIMLLFAVSACSSSEKVKQKSVTKRVGNPGPRKIWEPEYYVYKNGKFKFYKGHYRLLVFRKQYYQRSLKGYASNADYAAAK